MLRNRGRRLGWATVGGQVLFMATLVPWLARLGRRRISELMRGHGLRDDPLPEHLVRHVPSVNDPEVVVHLQARDPAVVLVNGTRIIRRHVLDAVGAPFLNTHAGITPRYRGVHGGYWALWNGEPEQFGVTIHEVDPGVDTGAVLHQARPVPSAMDSFVTYPLLQQAASLPALLHLLKMVSEGRSLPPVPDEDAPSKQWYHPTLCQYLQGRLRGVK